MSLPFYVATAQWNDTSLFSYPVTGFRGGGCDTPRKMHWFSSNDIAFCDGGLRRWSQSDVTSRSRSALNIPASPSIPSKRMTATSETMDTSAVTPPVTSSRQPITVLLTAV